MPLAQFTLPITFDEDVQINIIDLDPAPDPWSAIIPAGTYYCDGSGTADDLIKVMTDVLNATDPRGSWLITEGQEKVIKNENYIGTTAAVRFVRTLTSGTMVAFAGTEDLIYALGFSKIPIASGDPEWISYIGNTWIGEGLYMRKFMYRPYALTSEEMPGAVAASGLSRTRGGKAAMQGYGQYRTLLWEAEGVLAAMCASHYSNDPAYASEAGIQLGDPNISLEQFWRWCRVLPKDSRPPVIRYCKDVRYPDIYKTVKVVSSSWINSLEATQSVIVDAPKRLKVNIPMMFTSEAVTPVSGNYNDTITIVTQGIPEFDDLYTALRGVAANEWFMIKYGTRRYYAQKIDEYQAFPHPPVDFPMRKWGGIGQMFLPISAQGTLDPFSFVGDILRIKWNLANCATATSGVGSTDERWVDDRGGSEEIGVRLEYRIPRPSTLRLNDVTPGQGFNFYGWVREQLYGHGVTNLVTSWAYYMRNNGGGVNFANFLNQVMSGNRNRRCGFATPRSTPAVTNIAYFTEQNSDTTAPYSFGSAYGLKLTGWDTDLWSPAVIWHETNPIAEDSTYDLVTLGGITQGME